MKGWGLKRVGPWGMLRHRRKVIGRNRIFYFSTVLSPQQHATPPAEEGTGSGPAWLAFNLTSLKDRRCKSNWQNQAQNGKREVG